MTTVLAFILVITTWTGQGPHISMQEFSSQESCKAEQARIDGMLLRHNDATTTTHCSPKA